SRRSLSPRCARPSAGPRRACCGRQVVVQTDAELALAVAEEGVSAHEYVRELASQTTKAHVRVGPRRARQRPRLGHGADRAHRSALTLRVYAHTMRRDQGERDRLRALVEGREWAAMGTGTAPDRSADPRAAVPENDESPATMGLSEQSGRPDLNRGPHRPERCALPGCATPRRAPSIDPRGQRPSPATAVK